MRRAERLQGDERGREFQRRSRIELLVFRLAGYDLAVKSLDEHALVTIKRPRRFTGFRR